MAVVRDAEYRSFALRFFNTFAALVEEPASRMREALFIIPDFYLSTLQTEIPDCRAIAHGSAHNVANCLRAGALDYLKEPWDAEEFWERVGKHIDPWSHQLSWCSIRCDGRNSYLGGIQLKLSAGAHIVLSLLLRTPGVPVKRSHLLWALDIDNNRSRLVDVYIAEIRSAFEEIIGRAGRLNFKAHRAEGYSISS